MTIAADMPAEKPPLTGGDRALMAPRRAQRWGAQDADELQRKYQDAVSAGQRRAARTYQRILGFSFGVKIAATDEAAKKQCHRLPEKMKPRDVVEAAFSLDMRQVPDEPVRLYAQPKDKGGWRPIHVYGVQNHARQIILGWMIQPRVQLDPRQFALQGGVPAAIAAAKDQINHHNARWAVEVDFTNCFGTIDREWAVNRLRGLGVPEQVTRATAFPDDNYVRTPTSSDWLWSDRYLSLPGPLTLRSQARSGVPQGAACSSLIAEIAISDILSALQITDQVVVYADNVLLMAPTRRELERLADTLGSAALRGSAGRFALKRGKVRRVDWGFDYLGHRIHSYRGKAHVEPSRAAMEDCAKTIMKRMRDVVRGKPRALRRLRSFCRGWAAAFSMWSRVVENIRGALFRGAMLLGRAAVDRLRDIMACATRAAGTEQHAGSRS